MILTCAFGIDWARHPGCLWCAAEGARLAGLFAEAVARGGYDADGYKPKDKRTARVEAYPVTIYISGPMTGLPNNGYDAFAAAAHWLRQNRFENVVSPHEIRADGCIGCGVSWTQETPLGTPLPPHDWNAHLRADITALMECDTIVLLPGWPKSRGSRLELTIAMELGMDVYFYDPDGVEKLTMMATSIREGA